jgi:DNA-binding MurR/RpiR family transcriptional regulator
MMHIMQRVNGMQRLLHENLSVMSPSQQRIARYALDHPDEVAFLSAQRLASRVQVSQSTVVRFPSVIGLDGYPTFQRALQRELRDKLSPAERLGASIQDEEGNLFQRVFAAEAANLQETRNLVTDADLDRASELLVRAPRLWIMGVRGSYPPAHMAAMLLHQVRPNVIQLEPSAGLLPDLLLDVDPSDALVAITYPRYHADITAAARLAKQAGASVLAITDSYSAPVAEHSDLLLRTACAGPSFTTSYVGAVAVVHALAAAAASRIDDAAVRLERLEKNRRNLASVLLADRGSTTPIDGEPPTSRLATRPTTGDENSP